MAPKSFDDGQVHRCLPRVSNFPIPALHSHGGPTTERENNAFDQQAVDQQTNAAKAATSRRLGNPGLIVCLPNSVILTRIIKLICDEFLIPDNPSIMTWGKRVCVSCCNSNFRSIIGDNMKGPLRNHPYMASLAALSTDDWLNAL